MISKNYLWYCYIKIDNIYSLININHFETSFSRAVCIRTESISYHEPKIWDNVPEEYKKLNNVSSFKDQLKNGYTLTVLAEFVKPMDMVLVF